MASNRQKVKGSQWEAQLVKIFNDNIHGAKVRKTPGSGGLGTVYNEALLTGDVVGKIDNFPKPIKVECKSGYSSSLVGEAKSISIRKEWIDKVKEESVGNYSMPMLACKFDNVHTGVKYFIILDMETFIDLINYTTDLKKELDFVYDELQALKSEKNKTVSTKE
jgi:Holliday junction resolvase